MDEGLANPSAAKVADEDARARAREDRRAANREAWRRKHAETRKNRTADDAAVPALPEDVDECARQARAVAWRILHGAERDSDRMNAARFFVEQAKTTKSPGEFDFEAYERAAEARAAERHGKE